MDICVNQLIVQILLVYLISSFLIGVPITLTAMSQKNKYHLTNQWSEVQYHFGIKGNQH
jgi:hypothetical protein